MDSLITAAARALAVGDTLGALKRVALRADPPALALRGIAMARLGEHARSRELLREAAKAFGEHEALAKARCVVAEAEVALALRDVAASAPDLSAARATLLAHGDRANALQASLIAVRQLILLGRLDEASALLNDTDLRGAAPALQTIAALAAAEVALRSLRTGPAKAALARAEAAAGQAGIGALSAEVHEMRLALQRPAARRVQPGGDQALGLEEVEALLGSGALVLDACRRSLRCGEAWLPLASRPILFELVRTLAEAWPGDVDRQALIAQVFRTRRPDETHRARLRVEIGRLRALTTAFARLEATPRGYALRCEQPVVVLMPPIDGEQASLLALLADGAAWSTSALALALGVHQRTIQRALTELVAEGRVRSIGQARSMRWLAPPLAGFTTILLLPTALPPG